MRTFLSLKTCLLAVLLLCTNSISASKIISVSDFGLKPDSRINSVPFIQKAIGLADNIPAPPSSFRKEDMTSGHSMPLKKTIMKRIPTTLIRKF